MGTSTALLTISDVTFRNLTGICNVCIFTMCPMIGTNLKFLDSVALATNASGQGTTIGTRPGSPVAWYTKAESTMTNVLCENLTANYYSGCCKFYGQSTWNSCIFRYIKGTQNGGMCCADANVIADNCTFLNLSTTGDFGGAIHWHSGTDTLIRCIMYNCTAGRTGGGMLFGSTYFLANCDFANNSAPQGGNDIMINSTGSPEAHDDPQPPTPSITYIYGCCSLSKHPRFNNNSNKEDDLLKDCVAEIRYVNESGRGGEDTVTCGRQLTPCGSLLHTATAVEVGGNDIPLQIQVDYGVYAETGVVLVENRPVKVTGTEEALKETVVKVEEGTADNLFKITTGTLTVTRIHFIASRIADTNVSAVQPALIAVQGNGTMTVYQCIFEQQRQADIIGGLQAPVVLIDNANSICNFEITTFRNIVVEDSSAVYISGAKRVSFSNCEFTNINSTLIDDGESQITQAGGAIYSNALQLTINIGRFTLCQTDRNGGAICFGPAAKLSLTDVIFDRCSARNGSGGALYINPNSALATDRYLARCQFLLNQASDGNDIRDETGTVASWTGANAIDCCSISKSLKFSVGDNSASFERYLSQCFNNPCLNHTVANCPLECDNSTDVCIPGNCTRLHYETTCPATCTIYQNNCVTDRCFVYKDQPTCEADRECIWDFPSSYTLSSGEEVIPSNTKVCQAAGPCTRQLNETNCTYPGCILEKAWCLGPERACSIRVPSFDAPLPCGDGCYYDGAPEDEADRCTNPCPPEDANHTGKVLENRGVCEIIETDTNTNTDNDTDTTPPPTDRDIGKSWWDGPKIIGLSRMWFVIAAGAVALFLLVLIIVIIVCVVRSKNKKKKDDDLNKPLNSDE